MNQCKRDGCENPTKHEHGFCERCGKLVWEFYMAHGFVRHSDDVLPPVSVATQMELFDGEIKETE